MFASTTFAEHILRGVTGVVAIAAAIWLGHIDGNAALAGSIGLGLVALVALRGCPVCWTTGLFEMMHSRRLARRSARLRAAATR